ncbi:glycosyl hydrolase [Leeuwenhoekiella polynyae]|uniref:Mannan endo-1,4-beta-mannosidase n=1 Tax=Leeuwenhoekiella polynyae TaxID=1550906 RepID=A0A4Q0P3S0_9FLAO|nr:glycosyl hydrolase [Leeuwenhoekiella polynyae]RXG20965.1 mannan endo-1,4-beta-mannosidase [Leeuwenhoekiella polynyae]
MRKIICLISVVLSTLGLAQTPVNAYATPEAKQILAYIASLGDNILSGQHSYNEEPEKFYKLAYEITGNYPAVWGTDFYWNSQKDPGERIVKNAIQKHEEGALVTLMWHVGRPTDKPPYSWSESVQNEFSDENWEQVLTPNTALHLRWLKQVDHVASYLKKLEESGVPVLWRPYHEMNGVWFWWGNNPEAYKKLWKILYNRLAEYHQLNNLIWVWNANAPRDIPFDEAFAYEDFYPGAEYVDILATDVYHYDYEQRDYEALLKLAAGKPIALGEVGELPKPNILQKQPKWSWFMVWSNWLETANTVNRVKEIYNYSKTITKDEIKK